MRAVLGVLFVLFVLTVLAVAVAVLDWNVALVQQRKEKFVRIRRAYRPPNTAISAPLVLSSFGS